MPKGLATLAGLIAAAGLISHAAQAQPPSFLRDGPCRLTTEAVPAVFAPCGELAVPEDPSTPDGDEIEIFVARIPAQSAEPRRDPLVLIAGGPGQSTVDFYLQSGSAFEQARRDRDIVLVDQRGTGRSATGFNCSAPDDVYADDRPETLMRLVEDCLARLEHDPRFYTTSVAVQDLERVRAALGIEQWNLYGISYGTRVAQHYLRRYPERVRSIVLDGVVPAPLALGPDIAHEAQRALGQIFARCAADIGCADAFTNLAEDFAALLERLDTAAAAEATDAPPLKPAELRTAVRLMSYAAPTVALLPVMLEEAYDGNYSPLSGQAKTLLRDVPESLSFPMSNAVTCTEDVPFIDASAGTEGLESTYLGTQIIDALEGICAHWPRGVIDPDFKAPLTSDRPALLLSGEFDPITPPAYAERVIAGGLGNSVHLIGPKQGHGIVGVGCVPRLLRSFLEDPSPATVDASCLATEPPTPFFLSLLGPAP